MGVSGYILQIIENNRTRLTDDIDIKHFLIYLRNEHVLNDDHVEDLEAIPRKQTRNDNFIKILEKSDDQGFEKFCKLLARSKASAIQNLGNDLLQQVKNGRNQGENRSQPERMMAESDLEISKLQAEQALDKHRQDFIRFVPVKDLLFTLESNRIIDMRQKADMNNISFQDDRRATLFYILRNERKAKDFVTFCNLLQKNQVSTVQEFGKTLLNAAISS